MVERHTKDRGRWGLAAAAAAVLILGFGAAYLTGALEGWLPGEGAEAVVVEDGGLRMEVRADPAVPRAGSNRFRIRLTQQDGKPVDDAEIAIRYFMPAMGAMPAMGGSAAVERVGAGRYRADYDLSMGGSWQLTFRAARPTGEVLEAEGSLSVGRARIALTGVGALEEHPEEIAELAPARHAAEVRIDMARRQRVGIRTVEVVQAPMTIHLRAVGRVTLDEGALRDVSPRVRGWVGELFVAAVGDPVERGQTLFTLYSPDLYAAQEEFLQALRSQRAATDSSRASRSDALVRAARNRLRLWEIPEADVDRMARREAPEELVPFRAPVSGYVVEKNIVEGSSVEPGQRVLRIAPLDRVWIEAELYEGEIETVSVDQPVTVTLPYRPGERFEGRIAHVYPTLRRDTRTALVRVVLPNPDLALRPDMYAHVELAFDRGTPVVVPASAVLYAGPRRFVFLDLGDGRLRPQEVEVGHREGDLVEILSGVAPGDVVVASGTFLVASESRLRSALDQW
jgi:membrane fusion protein, copper/silver efflux system